MDKNEMYNIYKDFDKSEMFLLGFEFNGYIYGFFTNDVNVLSTQTNHKTDITYLRYRPHKRHKQIFLNTYDCICFGTMADLKNAYPCNNKQGYNKGYGFEILVAKSFGIKWVYNNKPFYECGDLVINGIQTQLKYQGATICNSRTLTRLLNQ